MTSITTAVAQDCYEVATNFGKKTPFPSGAELRKKINEAVKSVYRSDMSKDELFRASMKKLDWHD
ncbi:hypothetical protein GJ654_18940 [Rhodoblastus acidophilus]|uniref:Uncharacterized protein n=1 Tax=Rhodoblastus acidophilus TaxID=1074 RepID=A0A6N8DV79_RHOAC|nr:hypothetical protein [Rhodoblastus acidophilus]MCW2276405.1 hypothetical protein [Rhodoblastus acidophilus]MTV33061.1 hypothetical protein [Rhodoblastus acidophilus]